MTQESIQNRKADTRRKIQMGGLIATAKIDSLFDESSSIRLGLLLDAKQQLNNNSELKNKCKLLGEEYFKESK